MALGRRSAQSGFSVIEALAALALVAIALLPLSTLQAEIARGHARRLEVHEQAAALQNALVFIRGVNLMATPRGARAIGEGQSITWNAQPISEARPALADAAAGAFVVRLYRVRIDIVARRSTNTIWIEQLGWQDTAAAG